jgi:dipeptidyl-peptidase-3
LKDHIYALTPEASLSIGKRSLGHTSNYYLGEPINDNEVADVQTAAEKIGIDVLNTRFLSPMPLLLFLSQRKKIGLSRMVQTTSHFL